MNAKSVPVTRSMVVSPAGELVTGGVKCYWCGGVGYTQRACPLFSTCRVSVPKEHGKASNVQQQKKAGVQVPKSVQPLNENLCVNEKGTNPWVVVVIKEWRLPSMLDSRSFLRRDIFERMKLVSLIQWSLCKIDTLWQVASHVSWLKQLSVQSRLIPFLGSLNSWSLTSVLHHVYWEITLCHSPR